MTDRVLVDTGPLVAIQSVRDAYHKQCVDQLRTLHPPLITCWPVLTETAWLLRTDPAAIQRTLAGFGTGLWQLGSFGDDAPAWIARFMDRYKNIGAQLADAALMYLAEWKSIDTIFTLDFRDFSVYRRSDGRPLKILPLVKASP